MRALESFVSTVMIEIEREKGYRASMRTLGADWADWCRGASRGFRASASSKPCALDHFSSRFAASTNRLRRSSAHVPRRHGPVRAHDATSGKPCRSRSISDRCGAIRRKPSGAGLPSSTSTSTPATTPRSTIGRSNRATIGRLCRGDGQDGCGGGQVAATVTAADGVTAIDAGTVTATSASGSSSTEEAGLFFLLWMRQ